MSSNAPYYPKYRLANFQPIHGNQLWQADTCIRVKYRGKWYKWVVSVYGEREQDAVAKLVTEVYYAMKFGKVTKDLIKIKDSRGFPVLTLDELQISEEERLK